MFCLKRQLEEKLKVFQYLKGLPEMERGFLKGHGLTGKRPMSLTLKESRFRSAIKKFLTMIVVRH